jgi:hypothetical protein
VLVILQKSAFFKSARDEKVAVPVDIIYRWIRNAKKIVKSSKKRQMAPTEVLEALDGVESPDEVVSFEKHRHSFRGEVEKTWRDWVMVLFIRSCRDEVQKMESFQEESDAAVNPLK